MAGKAGACSEDTMLEPTADPKRNALLPPRACRPATNLVFAFVALVAFAVYWASSFVLVARDGTEHFHVDTWLYTELSEPNLFDRILPDSQLSRIFRFHPVTVVLAAGWMKVDLEHGGIWVPKGEWFEGEPQNHGDQFVSKSLRTVLTADRCPVCPQATVSANGRIGQ